jgi:hypothetical protein
MPPKSQHSKPIQGGTAWVPPSDSALLGVVTTGVRNMNFILDPSKMQHFHLYSDLIFFLEKFPKNMLDQGFGHL